MLASGSVKVASCLITLSVFYPQQTYLASRSARDAAGVLAFSSTVLRTRSMRESLCKLYGRIQDSVLFGLLTAPALFCRSLVHLCFRANRGVLGLLKPRVQTCADLI